MNGGILFPNTLQRRHGLCRRDVHRGEVVVEAVRVQLRGQPAPERHLVADLRLAAQPVGDGLADLLRHVAARTPTSAARPHSYTAVAPRPLRGARAPHARARQLWQGL
eukprot:gene12672-biopygen15522